MVRGTAQKIPQMKPNDSESFNSEHVSKIDPVVFQLGLVSFFADIASEMLYPVTNCIGHGFIPWVVRHL